MSRIAILSNTLSHLNRASMVKMREVTKEQPDVIHRELHEMAEFPTIFQEFAAAEPELLVINGGDGTVDAAITYIVNAQPFKELPAIALLPGGRTNMTAADFGARHRADKLLADLIEKVRTGQLNGVIENRAVLRVDWRPDEPPLYGFFFGAAAIVSGIEFCRRRIFPLGLPNFLSHFLTVFLLLGMTIRPGGKAGSAMNAAPLDFTINGGPVISGTYFMLTVTTLNRLVLGLSPFARNDNGTLKLTTIEHSVCGILRAAAAIVRGKAGRVPVAGMTCENGDEVRLELDGPFTLDGEFYDPAPGRPVVVSTSDTLSFVRFE
ncbi:MAG: diacylglycerol/lipid kinase family protein [Sphingomonadales bacterium]